MVKPHLKMNLIENAFDYLLSAEKYANDRSVGSRKYGILHLVNGIELLLKARLQKEHWSILFSDIDRASADKFNTGDFVSVDFGTAINRLEEICGVKIDANDREKLGQLRILRNRIQHFAFSLEQKTLLSLLGYGFSFSIRFARSELESLLDKNSKESLQNISVALSRFEEFYKNRIADITPELRIAKTLRGCPHCWAEALVLGNGSPKCLFCGYSDTPDNVLEEVGTEAVDLCPSCSGPCNMEFLDAAGSRWVCYSCGEIDDYDFCEDCGRLFKNRSPDYICSDCLRDQSLRV